MIVLDTTDVLEGGASVNAVIDYSFYGMIGSTLTQLATGVMGTALTAILFTAGDVVVVTSIILVNKHTSAVNITLALDPANGGNPRYIIPKTLSLGVNYSLHTDGVKTIVLDANGALVTTVMAAATHKDSHDPSGSDALDAGSPNAILEVQAQAEGGAESWARSDHDHAIAHDITNNSLVTVDGPGAGAPANGEYAKFTANGLEGKSKVEHLSDLNVEDGADVTANNETSHGDVLVDGDVGIADNKLLEVDDVGPPAAGQYARFTADGLEGRTEAEFKGDFNLEIGTDVLAQKSIGIVDNNLVEVDGPGAGAPNSGEYVKWTPNGVEGKTVGELKADAGLDNVENSAHSADAHTMAIDGRDVSADGTKLDGVEPSADVTDEANVAAAFPISDVVSIVKDPADNTKRMRLDVGAIAPSTIRILTMPNQNIDLNPGVGSFATEAEGTLAADALPKAGGQMAGNITMAGAETVDTRDLSVDGSKLDGIAPGADVTSVNETSHSDVLVDGDVGIADNDIVAVDGPGAGAPVNGEYAKFTASGLESKSKAEHLSDLDVADGADVTGDNAPQAHKVSHQDAGGDEINVGGLSGLLAADQHVLDAEVKLIKLDDMTPTDDNTDLNSSITKHGLLLKLNNVATNYLNGQGAWTEPPSGGGAPDAHKVSHQDAGSDEISVTGLSGLLANDQHVLDAEVKAIKLDDFATPDDNTDLNASTSVHGLLKKLNNDVDSFLNGQGAWVVPAGGGDVATDAIWDAAGDLAQGSGADAAARLALGAANKKLFVNAAANAFEWAEGIKVGTFTKDLATSAGTQVISGIGFKPSRVIFIAGKNDTYTISFGFDNGTLNVCVYAPVSGTEGFWGTPAASYSIFLASWSGVVMKARITAFGNDGFTLTWAKDGAPSGIANIHLIAFR